MQIEEGIKSGQIPVAQQSVLWGVSGNMFQGVLKCAVAEINEEIEKHICRTFSGSMEPIEEKQEQAQELIPEFQKGFQIQVYNFVFLINPCYSLGYKYVYENTECV